VVLTPLQMLIIGTLFVLIGFILPWLMVLRLVESTLFLNFFAYLSMVGGSALGLVGAILYRRERD
jgi:hypothetical protein